MKRNLIGILSLVVMTVLISATGALAQGLEAEQTGPGGLVTAQCGAPGTS